MRLHNQKEISQEKLKQNSREIEHGLALAKKVDELRAKKAKEEIDVEKWRSETLRHSEEQIREATARRDQILTEAKEAEERRLKAQAPLDKEWVINQKQRKANEDTARELLERETRIIARETGVQVQESALLSLRAGVEEKNELATKYLNERKIEYDKVARIRAVLKEKLDKLELDIRESNEILNGKAEELALMERNLRNERESIEQAKLDIADEKLHIQSQQETLRAAWQHMRKLQANQ